MRTSLIGAVALLALAGCGGESFQDADPNGWRACQVLIESQQSSDPTVRLGSILETGKLAIAAESADIRASASRLGGSSAMTDAGKLEAACEAHGVTIPAPVAVFNEESPAAT